MFTGAVGAPAAAGSPAIAPTWTGEIEPLLVAGAPLLNEVVFHHRASRTLICTDLLFNVTHPATWMTSVALTLMGTKGRLATSRAWWLYTRNRAALKNSLEQLLRWDFARVIPAHGDVVEPGNGAGDVRELTRSALHVMF
jgi:glyoxylase-like metal-dependent hydrolase (beta-lactamase superfamily II)